MRLEPNRFDFVPIFVNGDNFSAKLHTYMVYRLVRFIKCKCDTYNECFTGIPQRSLISRGGRAVQGLTWFKTPPSSFKIYTKPGPTVFREDFHRPICFSECRLFPSAQTTALAYNGSESSRIRNVFLMSKFQTLVSRLCNISILCALQINFCKCVCVLYVLCMYICMR
jgi:hypothetical protein